MAFDGATFVLVCTQMLTAVNKDKSKLTDSAFREARGGGFTLVYRHCSNLGPLVPHSELQDVFRE